MHNQYSIAMVYWKRAGVNPESVSYTNTATIVKHNYTLHMNIPYILIWIHEYNNMNSLKCNSISFHNTSNSCSTGSSEKYLSTRLVQSESSPSASKQSYRIEIAYVCMSMVANDTIFPFKTINVTLTICFGIAFSSVGLMKDSHAQS